MTTRTTGAADGRGTGEAPWAIRPPRPHDAAALGALHNLVWRHAYAGLMSQAYLDARDDVAAAQRWASTIEGLDAEGRAADGRRTLVALTDAGDSSTGGSVVGFVTAGAARRPEHAGMAELMALYVHPSWHGTGVARALVGAVGLQRPAMLWVLDGNERAVRFYAKLGFEARDVVLVHEPTGACERLMVAPAECASGDMPCA